MRFHHRNFQHRNLKTERYSIIFLIIGLLSLSLLLASCANEEQASIDHFTKADSDLYSFGSEHNISGSADDSSLDFSIDGVEQDVLQFAVQFRDAHGLQSSADHMENVFQQDLDSNVEEWLGFPLTEEELVQLTRHIHVQGAMIDLRETLGHEHSPYLDSFTGITYDAQNERVVVQLEEASSDLEGEIRALFPYPEQLQFEEAGHR